MKKFFYGEFETFFFHVGEKKIILNLFEIFLPNTGNIFFIMKIFFRQIHIIFKENSYPTYFVQHEVAFHTL